MGLSMRGVSARRAEIVNSLTREWPLLNAYVVSGVDSENLARGFGAFEFAQARLRADVATRSETVLHA
jgi:hypothetical protein